MCTVVCVGGRQTLRQDDPTDCADVASAQAWRRGVWFANEERNVTNLRGTPRAHLQHTQTCSAQRCAVQANGTRREKNRKLQEGHVLCESRAEKCAHTWTHR